MTYPVLKQLMHGQGLLLTLKHRHSACKH